MVLGSPALLWTTTLYFGFWLSLLYQSIFLYLFTLPLFLPSSAGICFSLCFLGAISDLLLFFAGSTPSGYNYHPNMEAIGEIIDQIAITSQRLCYLRCSQTDCKAANFREDSNQCELLNKAISLRVSPDSDAILMKSKFFFHTSVTTKLDSSFVIGSFCLSLFKASPVSTCSNRNSRFKSTETTRLFRLKAAAELSHPDVVVVIIDRLPLQHGWTHILDADKCPFWTCERLLGDSEFIGTLSGYLLLGALVVCTNPSLISK